MPRELVAARQPGGRLRGRAPACCAVAVAAGLLALAWQPPTGKGSSAELEGDARQLAEEQSNPVLRIGHGFHFYDVSGFDEGSLQRRVRLDAADQDANAALQWANAQRLRRDAAGAAEPVQATVQSRDERKTRSQIIPHRSWITPFRASQATSKFRAVAPAGFKRAYVDTVGGGQPPVHSTTGAPGGDTPGGERDMAPTPGARGLDSRHPQGAPRTEPSPTTIRNEWADGPRSLARSACRALDT